MTEPVAIGFDIGGTNLRAATVAADGTILDFEAVPNPAPRGAGPAAGDRLVAAIAAGATRLGPGLPIGVGIAGLVDRSGRFLEGPNVGIEDLDLGSRLLAEVGGTVTVVNDASAAAYGEFLAGAARDATDAVLVTIGTGVGGGVVIDGQLLLGAHGLAPELGHLIVVADGRPCLCGAHGCLEAYVSGRSIGLLAAERRAAGTLEGALVGVEVLDGVAVTAAAAAGDRGALEVLAEAGHVLGIGLASLVNVFDPDVLLIGGGAGQAAGQWLIPAAEQTMAANIIARERRDVPPLQLAALGDDAGVVGAALLAAGH